MNSTEIAQRFNEVNEVKAWVARANSRPESGLDVVHFNTASKLVSLIYNHSTGAFEVKFNKFQAAWGDYVQAIAKSLFFVLTTLKQAGLPFDAPTHYEGMEIVARVSGDAVFVRWSPHIDPVMPEVAARQAPVDSTKLFA